jgi:hypothetical protein
VNCRNPDCRREAMPDDKGCLEHGELLRRVRRELEENGNLTSNQRKKGGKFGPTCCVLGCYESRPKGEAFCTTHQDEGYVQEAA